MTGLGAPSVTHVGATVMLRWYVGSWDSFLFVSSSGIYKCTYLTQKHSANNYILSIYSVADYVYL